MIRLMLLIVLIYTLPSSNSSPCIGTEERIPTSAVSFLLRQPFRPRPTALLRNSPLGKLDDKVVLPKLNRMFRMSLGERRVLTIQLDLFQGIAHEIAFKFAV